MKISELRALLTTIEEQSGDVDVTIFGPGPGLPVRPTGEWTRKPGAGEPVLLHGRIDEEAQ